MAKAVLTLAHMAKVVLTFVHTAKRVTTFAHVATTVLTCMQMVTALLRSTQVPRREVPCYPLAGMLALRAVNQALRPFQGMPMLWSEKQARKVRRSTKKGTLNLQGSLSHTTPGTSSKHPVNKFSFFVIY